MVKQLAQHPRPAEQQPDDQERSGSFVYAVTFVYADRLVLPKRNHRECALGAVAHSGGAIVEVYLSHIFSRQLR